MAVRISALLYLTFWGCRGAGERILERRFPEQHWIFPDTIWGGLSVPSPATCRDIALEIDIAESYRWRNLYLMTFVVAPDGFRTQSRIELVFSDSLGNWYVSNRKFRTFVARNLSFSTAGTYRIGLLPYIRSDTVSGIRRVSLSTYPCPSE